MSSSENKNQINNDKKETIMDEQKQKIKSVSNKLNTKLIFQNKTEVKTKSSNSKISTNPKQIFKKINLKTASRLIANPNVASLLKIKPVNKAEANNAIKAIKSSIKIKEKTFIPNKNKSNYKNIKPTISISDTQTNIQLIKNNKFNTINKSQKRKENPFNLHLFEQPIDPMTLEMEKFKKMRLGEKNYIKKKLSMNRKLNSSRKMPKINNSNNINDLTKSEDIVEILKTFNTFDATEDKVFNDNKYIFKSYIENIENIAKGRLAQNKEKLKKDNKLKINSTISFSNSYSINYKSLNIESDIKNSITNRQSIKTFESSKKLENKNDIALKERAKKITKEKEALKKALTSKKSSSLGSMPKNPVKKRIKITKKNTEKKMIVNRLSNEIKSIKSYDTIPQQTYHKNKIINTVKIKTNKKKSKIDVNNSKNKSSDNISKVNVIIKKKFNIVSNIMGLKKKENIKYFLKQLKQYTNIKEIKNEINAEKNNKKNEIISLELNKKEKNNKINKEAFDKFSEFYNKKLIKLKKYSLSKMKHYSNIKKKIESIKHIRIIINKKYISKIKSFFASIKKYISNKNKIKSAQKFIIFFSKYYKSKVSKSYLFIKQLIKTRKKFDATKKIKNCISKYISNEKNKIFTNFKNYFNKSKRKEAILLMSKIFLNKNKQMKKDIFNSMNMYYKKKKKIESINTIRNLLINGRKNKVKMYIYNIKNICGYKNKIKSIRNLSDLIKRKILFDKKMSYNSIKKYYFMMKIIEGINRFNDIFIQIKLTKLRIYFFELINNIKKIRISNGFQKIAKIYSSKKKVKDNKTFKLIKQYYKSQIKKNQILLLFNSIFNKRTKAIKKLVIEYFKNYIKEYQNKKKLMNMYIDTTSSFVLEKKNVNQKNENINKIENNNIINNKTIKFKKQENNIKSIGKIENEEDSDNEVWTTCVEKWDIIYNLDDSLYQKNDNE